MPRAKNDSATEAKPLRRRAAKMPGEASAAPPNVTEAKPPTGVGNQSLPAHETPFNAEEEIRRRAYELYEQDGRQHGRDREHWLRAEAEVLGRGSGAHQRRGQKSA